MSIHFINNINDDFFKEGYLWKTMPLENLIRTLRNGLWFAKPSSWADPYERKFYDLDFQKKGKIITNPFKNRIFCCCMTTINASEAHWKQYSNDSIGARLKIDRMELFNILKSFCKTHDIFIGKVDYKSTKTIDKPINQNHLFKNSSFNCNNIEDCAKLLFLKRKSFQYESEIRLLLVSKKSVPQEGVIHEICNSHQ